MEITQHNSAGQSHGYWERYHGQELKLWYKCHYFNKIRVGYQEKFYKENIVMWESHWLNGNLIGCEKYLNSQIYHNKPGNKFGEEIKWE